MSAVHSARSGFQSGSRPCSNLLWTGGWDSTFQLLQLLLVHRRRVTPYYLADATRRSTDIELRTMDRIRERLAQLAPETAVLLSPTRRYDVADLAGDAEIDGAFRDVVRQHFMGNQYAWLARFCRQQHVDSIELCIHRDDKAHAALEAVVMPVVEGDGGYRVWRLDPARASAQQMTVFGAFSFPLFETTKLDMARIAGQRGWNEIMHMTWFCHRPGRDQRPCGRCNPCLYTIEEGLGWRIPMTHRVTSLAYRALVRPLRAPAKAIVARWHTARNAASSG